MDRRTFLRGSAGAAAASLFDFGCATTGAASEPSPPADVDAHIQRYDHIMAGIRSAPMRVAFRPEEESLVRGAMASLFAAGSYADLDPEWKKESRVERRLLESMPTMDHAVFGMTDYLERLEATERHAIHQRLRQPDGLLDEIVEGLGVPAAALGVPEKRRRHLEQLTRDTGARFIHQPPSIVIDDTVSGIRRLETRHGWTPDSRALMAAQIQKRLKTESTEEYVNRIKSRDKDYADHLITAGAITMGVSAGVIGVGLGVAFGAGIEGLVIVTIGALALVAGLIVLIVGYCKRP